MSQLDLIGFLDTVGISVGTTSHADPSQLTIRFDKIDPNEEITDATPNDVSRLTNLFQTAWVYLRPEDIISYTSDGTTTTLLLKPIATVVQPGKNTDIYSLFAIKGTVDEKIVNRQSAVELTTARSNVLLPTDPTAAAAIIGGTSTPVTVPENVMQGQIGAPTVDDSQVWRQAWALV